MNLCQEMSGFLFRHSCGRPAHMMCGRCAKPICAQHARPQPPESFLCVSCAVTSPPPGDHDRSDSGGGDWDDDDPHFYSRDYHQKSGGNPPDGMDFTDGDRASTGGEGGAWEEDAGGS